MLTQRRSNSWCLMNTCGKSTDRMTCTPVRHLWPVKQQIRSLSERLFLYCNKRIATQRLRFDQPICTLLVISTPCSQARPISHRLAKVQGGHADCAIANNPRPGSLWPTAPRYVLCAADDEEDRAKESRSRRRCLIPALWL